MANVRKFKTGIEGQGGAAPEPARTTTSNKVPDIPAAAVHSVAASAPVQIRTGRPGNPRARRYRQKTYSLTQDDIDAIEALVMELRQAGLYERGRSDIVRAGVRLLAGLALEDKKRAVAAVPSLKE